MSDFDKEVMWAVSGTGEDFQCVHVDFAREQQAEIKRLRAALQEIADDPCMDPEGNSQMARAALNQQNRNET